MTRMSSRIKESNQKRSKTRRIPKILAPVNSFEGAVKVIDAGADEIYCGVTMTGKGKYFGLYRGPGASPAQLPSYDDLEKVVQHAHLHGVKVVLVANEPFMSEELEEGVRNHIRVGVDKGVDALMIGDMGVLSIARNLGVDVPFIASTYFVSMNSEAIDFLRELGFSRVVLERHLTLHEISEIVKRSKIDIEVFCHYGGCSNINASCYFYHLRMPDRIKREWQMMTKSLGRHTAPCTILYDVYEMTDSGDKRCGNAPVMDALTYCSLCHIQALVQAGVAGLKIVGRLRQWHGYGAGRGVAADVKIYRKLLDLVAKASTRPESIRLAISSLREEYDHLMIEECRRALRAQGGGAVKYLPFYEFYCRQKRCIFSNLFNAPYKEHDLKSREIRL